MQQRKEIREVEGDATSRLTDAGSHVRQTRHEVANLKAKVRFHMFFSVAIAVIIAACSYSLTGHS